MDVLFAAEVREKVTRSFCRSTAADWLNRTPFRSGTVIRTICDDQQRQNLINDRKNTLLGIRGSGGGNYSDIDVPVNEAATPPGAPSS